MKGIVLAGGTGRYFYDNRAVSYAKSLKPRKRGYAWFDAGTADSLIEAANYVRTLEKHQGIYMASRRASPDARDGFEYNGKGIGYESFDNGRRRLYRQ
jgi:dTDP-glucose pyrophosphorylase